jgi:hypothetical protein
MGLRHPALPQFLPVGEESLGYLALLTAGSDDQHHPVALLESLADHAATGNALVVRMSVE